MMQEIKVYTILEVAELLKVTRRTVYMYLKAGKLKATKIGREWRVSHKDLQDFIEQGTK